MRDGDSALDEYAATNEAQTLAPVRLRRRHPELYDALRDYLNQDPAGRD